MIRDGRITPLCTGWGFGGNPTSMCVTDFDGDEKPELLYTSSVGSGMVRSGLVLQQSDPAVPLPFAAHLTYTYSGCSAEKVDDQRVNIIGSRALVLAELTYDEKSGAIRIERTEGLEKRIEAALRVTANPEPLLTAPWGRSYWGGDGREEKAFRCRLRPDKRVFLYGEAPTFKTDVRNRLKNTMAAVDFQVFQNMKAYGENKGKRDLPLDRMQEVFGLTVDGKLYRSGNEKSGAMHARFPRGVTNDISVVLDPKKWLVAGVGVHDVHLPSKDDPDWKQMPAELRKRHLAYIPKDLGKPMQPLPPGRHTAQAVMTLNVPGIALATNLKARSRAAAFDVVLFEKGRPDMRASRQGTICHVQLSPPIDYKRADLSLAQQSDALREMNFAISEDGEAWLILRSKNLDMKDVIWIDDIVRSEHRINIRSTVCRWTGGYDKNIPYCPYFAVNLGKLSAGKYTVDWTVRNTSYDTTKMNAMGRPAQQYPDKTRRGESAKTTFTIYGMKQTPNTTQRRGRMPAELNTEKKRNQEREETDLLEKAMQLAEKQWATPADRSLWNGKSVVREVKLIESEALSKALPGCTAFRVKVYNPRSEKTGRPFFPHTLVLDDETTLFLENGKFPVEKPDKVAAELLARKGGRASNAQEVRQRVETFAELRGLKLQEGMPPHQRAQQSTKPEDWKVTISKAKDGWQVSCVFLTDPYIGGYAQYHFQIRQDGRMVPKFVNWVFKRAGGYA